MDVNFHVNKTIKAKVSDVVVVVFVVAAFAIAFLSFFIII